MISYQTTGIKYYSNGLTRNRCYINPYIIDRQMFRGGFMAAHRKIRLMAKLDSYMHDSHVRLHKGGVRRRANCIESHWEAFLDALDLLAWKDHIVTPEIIAEWLMNKALKAKER
jgi:hypothetical protein